MLHSMSPPSFSVILPLNRPCCTLTFSDHVLTYQPTGQSGAKNNGSVYSVADQLNASLTQAFTYDQLNR
ncbi:MAG: hypothetical protein ACRD4F_12300, partial [Candidatus Angelobacter sp.]